MASNYPPGVSGTEWQITGEWDVDPRAPWADVSCEDGPVLYNPLTCEERWYWTEEERDAWLPILNGLYALDAPPPECAEDIPDWYPPAPVDHEDDPF